MVIERKASIDLENQEKELKMSDPVDPKLKTLVWGWRLMSREEEINEFRNKMHISVQGGDIPAPITTFDEMPFRKDQGALKHTILHNIEGFGMNKSH